MWKNLTRGIRETLERRVCRTNVYSQTPNDENNTNLCTGANTSVNVKTSYLDLAKYQNSFCGFFNSRGAKDKKHYSDWDKCTQRSFTDVLGWSGLLALGWVICQTPYIRKHIFEKNRQNGKGNCRFSQIHKTHFSNGFNLQPKHILPVINCIPNSNKKDEFLNKDNEWLKDTTYGPITAEEALGTAKDDFTAVHRIVMGELELQIGVKALGEERYKEAIDHFTTGAKLSSPGSMFNLGLCYELGIGTLTDTVKAAKYYQEAAERGHAGAMYNLGVFHAQGRGGLSKNTKIARNLFTKAAGLGQTDAKQALELEKTKIKERELAFSNKTNSTVPSKPTKNYSKPSKIRWFTSNNNFNNDSRDNSYEPYYSSNKIDDHTENFLNFLGIQSKSVPIRMEMEAK